MTMRKTKMAVLLLAIAGTALLLTGCQVKINTGTSGLSDFSYSDAEKYLGGTAELSETVEHIEIDWPVGTVTVTPHNADTVSFSEESSNTLTDDTRLHYWLDGTTLRIKLCGSGKWKLDELKKDLTVLVPEDLMLTRLKVSCISAAICLDTVQAESAAISTTSGNIQLTGCAVTELAEVSTVSGRLEAEFAQPLNEFNGRSTSGKLHVSAPSITRFQAGTVSGVVSLSAQTAPEALGISTISGNIGLSLPEDASFTLDYDSTSGDLSSDLPCHTDAGKYIFGDGNVKYTVSTVSGDVQITTVR